QNGTGLLQSNLIRAVCAQSEISDFGFEMQDSSNLKISSPYLSPTKSQYARAKMTRRSERAPHLTHLPSSAGESLGMLRIVAFVSSFTSSSHSPEPHQCDQMNPPSPSRISANFE